MMVRSTSIRMYLYFLLLIFSHAFAATINESKPVLDNLITTHVNQRLEENTETNPYHIIVTTKNGIVSLEGTTRTIHEATTAIEIAQSTNGVKDVDASRLVPVQLSTLPLADDYLNAKVKGILIREALIYPYSNLAILSINSNDGVVHIEGTVTNQLELDRIVSTIRSINGVKRIITNTNILYKVIPERGSQHG